MGARRNLVVGLGKTGLSVVRWLHAQGEAPSYSFSAPWGSKYRLQQSGENRFSRP